MGTCCTTAEQQKEDKRLDNELKGERKRDIAVKKLLFLGPGGSGKSTIFKAIRKIHGEGYDVGDRLKFKDHIFAQVVEQMRLALECIEFLQAEEFDVEAIKLEKENINNKHVGEGGAGEEGGEGGSGKGAVKKEIDEVMISYNDLELSEAGQKAAETLCKAPTLQVTPQIADVIKALWAERAIKFVYALRSTMKIDDSCQFFWEDIERIAEADYVPNEHDILLVRYRTTGVIEQKFEIKRNQYHVFDVGGQKSERKKWIHCFEHVTAVLYCAALSCYNEVMFEDEEKNSMVDTLQLFEQIVNNEWFKDTAMILILTKKDLFAEKIQRIPITNCPVFQQYAGIPDHNDEVIEYITEVFKSKNEERHKQVYTHVVCCADKNNVEKVFADITEEIISATVERAAHLHSQSLVV